MEAKEGIMCNKEKVCVILKEVNTKDQVKIQAIELEIKNLIGEEITIIEELSPPLHIISDSDDIEKAMKVTEKLNAISDDFFWQIITTKQCKVLENFVF